LVENNTIYDSQLGIDIGSGKRNIIRNNSVTNCPDGIILSSNSDSEVYENTLDDVNEAMYAYYWSAHGEPHQNNKWYRNLIINANWGFFEMDRKNTSAETGPTSGHEYYNNVFYNVGGGSGYRGTFWFRGTDDIKFHHNTIYTRHFLEAEIFELVNNSENASFVDNIVSFRGNKGLVFIEDGSSALFDYNCYYNRDGEVNAVGVNDTIADPLFVNVAEGDLYLQNNSPCIDSGYDVGISDDFYGNSRPIGSGFDMGAYEYDPANTIFIDHQIPSGFQLSENYPNPFNPVTTISYMLPNHSYVELKVFSLLGEKIQILVNEHQAAGEYKVKLNMSGMSSGVYLYKLKAGSFEQVRKMLLIQ
jgi:parallel beta-helix repeat protein